MGSISSSRRTRSACNPKPSAPCGPNWSGLVGRGKKKKKHGPGSDFELQGLEGKKSTGNQAGEPRREDKTPAAPLRQEGSTSGVPRLRLAAGTKVQSSFCPCPAAGRGEEGLQPSSSSPLQGRASGAGSCLAKEGSRGEIRSPCGPRICYRTTDLLQGSTKPAPGWF